VVISYCLPLVFSPDSNPEENAKVLRVLLENLIAIDRIHLRYHASPKLYSSGVRYRLIEEWLDIPSLLMLGYGDCKSLAAYLIAERREAGQRCIPVFRWYPATETEGLSFHVLVHNITRNGRVLPEDPSKVLGMP
jgi:hypothetical protein